MPVFVRAFIRYLLVAAVSALLGGVGLQAYFVAHGGITLLGCAFEGQALSSRFEVHDAFRCSGGEVVMIPTGVIDSPPAPLGGRLPSG